MKAIKLFLIAVVVLGAIYGLLMLVGGGNSMDSDDGPDKERLFNRLQTEIDENWQDRHSWDASQFEADIDKLQQNKRKLKNRTYNTLLDQLAAYASDLLYQDMMAEFASPACDSAKIETYHRDLDYFLRKTTGYDNDENIQTMQQTYRLFKDIITASSKRYGVEPNFNYENGTWTDFNGYRSRILSERDGYRGNRYFGYIQDAQIVISALDHIAERMESAKTQFKNRLAQQIISAYQNHPKTEESSSMLGSVHSQFLSQFGRQNDLYQFVLNY